MPAPKKGFVMRTSVVFILAVLLGSSAAYAQEKHGYVQGAGIVSTMTGVTSGGVNGEVGVKLTPNLVVFGNIGNLRDIHWSSLQTNIDSTVTTLANDDGLTATGTARVPTWYSLGGARIQFPNRSAVIPYVFGSVGFAHLSPAVTFNYQSGTTLTGNDAVAGDDITADVVGAGLFTQPTATKNMMLRTGGGVQIPFGKYLMGDLGYSVSRISADIPIHAQDFTFGLGIKF